MKMIKKIVDNINEELKDAEKYAEDYIYEKAAGNSEKAQKYRMMSQEEMGHALFLHEKAVQEIETIKKVYTPSQEMLDMWDESHKHYVEWMAKIKNMTQM